ncbi:hypothetical protein GCK32_018335 [Trichostrongylus colubriformis]|uniref:Uncharacterized protein n=1 Tax=Trichostrongylus colubriformis TaxID=6319 RepID=A0AAN8FRM4_TRICO
MRPSPRKSATQSSSTRDRNTTSCEVIHRATLTFTHSNGSINGAQISYDHRTVSNQETRILLTVRIRFVEYRAPCQFSRFELQRGRFHCPSEITCWQELWLPLLTDVSPSTVPLLGCAIITALCIVFATVKRKGKWLDPISDNHVALSKKLL